MREYRRGDRFTSNQSGAEWEFCQEIKDEAVSLLLMRNVGFNVFETFRRETVDLWRPVALGLVPGEIWLSADGSKAFMVRDDRKSLNRLFRRHNEMTPKTGWDRFENYNTEFGPLVRWEKPQY